MSKEDEGAQITQRGALTCQACIPRGWLDEQAKAFVDKENLCGTTHGWQLRKEGSPYLAGAPERQPCSTLPDFVHVMFDA